MSHPVKRKRSTSPSRKKARTGATNAPETTTPTTGTTPDPVGPDVYADFLRAIGGEDQLPPAPPPAVVARPRPKNPMAGKVKDLRGNFGTGYHDTAHFKATSEKPNHGVWRGKLPQVKTWVKMALASIDADDRFVVDAKPGTNGGYTYLISMDGTTVGYLSGSSARPGERRPAQHIEVYLDRKGNTVSAFPSSPDIF